MVQDTELATLTSSGWDTSSAPVASQPNVYQSTSDPTVNSDTTIGVRIGDVWINTATGNEFRCISAADGAAIWRHVPRIWQSSVAVTITADSTDEVIAATVSLPANVMGANGRLTVEQLWTHVGASANDKTMRVRLGGISGTAHCAVVNTTSAAWKDIRHIANRNATNSQMSQLAAAAGANTLGGAPTTGAIDTTAATTLVITGQKEVGSESLVLESYRVTLTRPDIGP